MQFLIFLFALAQANLDQLERPKNSKESTLLEVIDKMSQDDLIDLLMPSQYGLLYARNSFRKPYFGNNHKKFL